MLRRSPPADRPCSRKNLAKVGEGMQARRIRHPLHGNTLDHGSREQPYLPHWIENNHAHRIMAARQPHRIIAAGNNHTGSRQQGIYTHWGHIGSHYSEKRPADLNFSSSPIPWMKARPSPATHCSIDITPCQQLGQVGSQQAFLQAVAVHVLDHIHGKLTLCFDSRGSHNP